MSEDKPLHVQVAEALGAGLVTNGYTDEGRTERSWLYYSPLSRALALVPRYDTDWSATGPLIEKYGVELLTLRQFIEETEGLEPGEHPEPNPSEWTALIHPEDFETLDSDGPTPLIAVCHLILALKKAGKL